MKGQVKENTGSPNHAWMSAQLSHMGSASEDSQHIWDLHTLPS